MSIEDFFRRKSKSKIVRIERAKARKRNEENQTSFFYSHCIVVSNVDSVALHETMYLTMSTVPWAFHVILSYGSIVPNIIGHFVVGNFGISYDFNTISMPVTWLVFVWYAHWAMHRSTVFELECLWYILNHAIKCSQELHSLWLPQNGNLIEQNSLLALAPSPDAVVMTLIRLHIASSLDCLPAYMKAFDHQQPQRIRYTHSPVLPTSFSIEGERIMAWVSEVMHSQETILVENYK